MDDLNFDELVDGALGPSKEGNEFSDEEETAQFEVKKLIKPKQRKGVVEAPGQRTASDTHGGFPAMDDETVEELANTNRLKGKVADQAADPTGPTDFGRIYKHEGLPTGDDAFTVFRLETLFNDEELAELDDKARVAAVRAILKSHDVQIDEIFSDAVARRDALDTYDTRFKSKIARAEEKIQAENDQLEREIEEYAAPRVAKIEKNQERLESMRQTYRDWFERKQEEQARITEIVEPWGGDERLRVTEKVASVPDAEPEADTRPTPAVSDDDVFDGPSELSVESAAEHHTGPWELGESSHDESSPRASSVETDLPNERVEATEPVDDSITGDFDIQPRVRLPVTPFQGLVAAFAILLWVAVGMLGPAQLVEVEAPYAFALSFGVPLVLALSISFLTRSGGKWSTGFFAFLFYLSVIAFVIIHLVRPAVFVNSLTDRPIWYIEEAGLGAEVEQTFYRAWGPYAELVGKQLGVEAAETDVDSNSPSGELQ